MYQLPQVRSNFHKTLEGRSEYLLNHTKDFGIHCNTKCIADLRNFLRQTVICGLRPSLPEYVILHLYIVFVSFLYCSLCRLFSKVIVFSRFHVDASGPVYPNTFSWYSTVHSKGKIISPERYHNCILGLKS